MNGLLRQAAVDLSLILFPVPPRCRARYRLAAEHAA